jgi:hypothetical protein
MLVGEKMPLEAGKSLHAKLKEAMPRNKPELSGTGVVTLTPEKTRLSTNWREK